MPGRTAIASAGVCLAILALPSCSTDGSGLDPGAGGAGGGAAGSGGVGGSRGDGGPGDGGASAGTTGTPDASGTADGSPPNVRDGGGGNSADAVLDGRPDAAAPDTDPMSAAGCSDGTREGFLDVALFPRIAACAGGWSLPGVVTPASRTPVCGRKGGDSSANPDGLACSVADLCAVGWHVCDSIIDVATRSATCEGAVPPGSPEAFYATRQTAVGTACMVAIGENNIHGCGTLGVAEDVTCAPLNRRLSHEVCGRAAPWECGGERESSVEASVVRKPGSARGGVLCCKD